MDLVVVEPSCTQDTETVAFLVLESAVPPEVTISKEALSLETAEKVTVL